MISHSKRITITKSGQQNKSISGTAIFRLLTGAVRKTGTAGKR